MKRKLTMMLLSMMMAVTAFAQSAISGTVVSASDGEPVIGAAVKVKGSAQGVVTDLNGKFTINTAAGKTLVISYVGMQTREIAAKNGMKVLMDPDDKVLDEVMVVAFGTQKKSAFTGSAAVVDNKELSKHTVANVADALVGSVSGLQIRGASGAPGSSQGDIQIRGIASMYASTKPLIVVDGAPYSGNLSNINPDDIETISVLKDASSAALYGARGAAGVILITTKKGSSSDVKFNVNMKWGADTRAVQDYEKITDPAQYYETAYQFYNNYAFYGQGKSAEAANAWANSTMIKQLGYNIYTVPTGEQLIGLDGKINPNATMGSTQEYNGETYYYTADDWTKAAYHTAFRQEYDINASASTDRTNMYASLGYLDQDGIIDNSAYKRLTTRFKYDYQARRWLKLGVNANWTHSKTDSNPNFSTGTLGSTNLQYYTSMIAPIYPIYVRVLDSNGNPVIRTDSNGNPQYDYGRAGVDYPNNRAFLQTGNPLGSNQYNNMYTTGNKLSLTGFVDVQFTDWLKMNVTSTIDWGHTNYSDYESQLYGPKVSVNGQIDKYQDDNFRQNHVQTLIFNKSFDAHNLSVTLGHEYYKTEEKYLYAAGQGLFSPEIQEIAAAANNQYSSTSYTSTYNVEGYFGNVLYNYDEKYFFQGAYRRDASSRFAKANRWGNFWSLGAGWIISKEKFFNAEWVDMLKLKASIGQKGNDGIGNFRYANLYSLSASGTYTMSPTFSSLGNEDITWETTTATNVGVEFELFKHRLTGQFEFYNNNINNLLFWLSIPESMGARGYYGNLGTIRNYGVEFSLQGNIVHTKDIDVTANFNIAHNKTKIVTLPEAKTKNYGGFSETYSNIQMWYTEGGEMFCPFLYEYAGVSETGEALYYYDEDLSPLGGKVSTNNTAKAGSKHSGTTNTTANATRYAQKSLLPACNGGFGLNVSAYGFDASVSFDYQIGGKVYDYSYAALMGGLSDAGDAGHAFSVDLLKAWTPNNTSSNIPRLQYTDQYTASSSTRWLTNASYLNFQSFSVGYTIPAKVVSKIGLTKLRVYATGENLCFWSARKGLDPRYSYEGSDYLPAYAPVRTIMGGIQISF